MKTTVAPTRRHIEKASEKPIYESEKECPRRRETSQRGMTQKQSKAEFSRREGSRAANPILLSIAESNLEEEQARRQQACTTPK